MTRSKIFFFFFKRFTDSSRYVSTKRNLVNLNGGVRPLKTRGEYVFIYEKEGKKQRKIERGGLIRQANLIVTLRFKINRILVRERKEGGKKKNYLWMKQEMLRLEKYNDDRCILFDEKIIVLRTRDFEFFNKLIWRNVIVGMKMESDLISFK